jgi:hypothetical protein
LIGLLFSNFVFAGAPGTFEKRCKVEYTQLDLITGTETIYKETSQFKNYVDHCKEGLKRLSKKLYKWLDKNNTNIISNISAFKCQVGNHDRFTNCDFSLRCVGYHWGRYRTCETYSQKISAYLVDKYPNKIGTNVYKEFNSIKTPIVD